MLVIRMQRTGRKGHAQFRVVVQDKRRTPTSGKIVAQLGHYNPHSKQTVLDKEKAKFYLDHGAQPSDRVVRLLKAEGVKLPRWVKESDKLEGKVRNPDKRRSTAPEHPVEESAPAVAEETAPEETKTEDAEKATEESKVEEPELAKEELAGEAKTEAKPDEAAEKAEDSDKSA